MKKAIFFLCTMLVCAGTYGQKNAATAKCFIQQMTQTQYEEAIAATDSVFQAQVTPSQLQQLWESLLTRSGQLQKIDSVVTIKLAPNAPYTAWYVYAQFEKLLQPFAITFNAANKIVGFALGKTTYKQTDSARLVFRERPFSLSVSGGTLKGTIMLPLDSIAHPPIALIIAGSGPTDRDGNAPQLGLDGNTYKLLAEALAKKGIASLRYDKRLIGESNDFAKDEHLLSFDNYVKDARSINHFLQIETRFSGVYILGHSEGSLIGILASERLQPRGFISLAGAGENIASTLKRQLSKTPYAAEADSILAQLLKGKEVKEIPQDLKMVFRPSVQPFLISMFKYNPATEIAKVKCPILLIQGSTDLQVKVKDAQRLKAANSAAQLKIIKGMNHILKDAPSDAAQNSATYNNPTLPLNTAMVQAVISFIKQQQRNRD